MRQTISGPDRRVQPKSLPRPLAVDILTRVETDGAFAEPLLDQCLSTGRITMDQDRRLLTELVYGTLRMQGYIDWLIGKFLQGGIRSLEPAVRAILRTAVYQRFFTERIPDFAIVSQAVDLTKGLAPHRTSFVNAVLRNIIRRHPTMPKPVGDETNADFISIVHSHPLWLVKIWLRRMGPDETSALCRANNKIPPFSLRVNILRASRDEVIRDLADEGLSTHKTVYSPVGVILNRVGKPLRETNCLQQGRIQVQDEASQLISRLVAPAGGERILDLCAGVGGKATHLAEIMGNQGRIVAVDIREGKIEALKTLMNHLGSTIIKPLVADARDDLSGNIGRSFDRVLVDAPCSGVGTLRRAPEIKWRLTAQDVKASTALQAQILDRAAYYVKQGGRLIYSTCSILDEENTAVIKSFLSRNKDFALQRPEGIDPSLLDQQSFFRSYPHRHGMDGFFCAVMVRRKKTIQGRRPLR